MKETRTDHARHLARISQQLREAGDVQLVVMDENGVGPAPVSLADELWLIASQLDWGAAMAVTRETSAP